MLDDLQCATAPTVLRLRHLLHELGDERLLVVATYRNEDLEHTHPLRDLLTDVRTAHDEVTTIDLELLTQADVAQMVMALAPSAPVGRVAAVAQQVHHESAGSPFFTSELLHQPTVTGQLVRPRSTTASLER